MSRTQGDLSAAFRRLIRTDGPIPIAQYMAEANARYYATRDPLGAAGDFVTAPEISQMFGEMIGGWIADIVLRAGGGPFAYVELGPGRGTLARDALRVIRSTGLAPQIHLIEGSPALRVEQRKTVPDAQFQADTGGLPDDLPLLVVANEFFDALAVRQLVKTSDGWRERMVGLSGDRFVPVSGDRPMDAAVPEEYAAAEEGTILETNPAADAIMSDLSAAIERQGGAMLTIDYGYAERQTGSTLQAVKAHEKVDPFECPGTADLTAHVDFAALARAARRGGCAVHGISGQGRFLMALGMGQRAAALSQRNPEAHAEVLTALKRLTAPEEMGELFKALALGATGWPRGAAFGPVAMG